MKGEEFNPCECIWSNVAIQRLLSILRQTQSACTENECYPISRLPGPASLPNNQPSSELFFMTIILGMMALLYFFRPNSLRQISYDDSKARDNTSGSNDDPPVPPPSAN